MNTMLRLTRREELMGMDASRTTAQIDFDATKCDLMADVVSEVTGFQFVIAKYAIQRGHCRCPRYRAALGDLYANRQPTNDSVDRRYSHHWSAEELRRCQDALLTHRYGIDDHFDHKRQREPIQSTLARR